LKNTIKNTKKLNATRKKTINDTIEKEGVGFDTLKATPKERNIAKESSRTPLKALKSSMPLQRKPLATQHRSRGGLIHQK
jgi:hypothetical protein